ARGVVRDKHGVSVGGCMGHGSRRDIAAGAATVFDHDVLMQTLAEALSDHARQRVGDPARRKGNDQRDFAGWISLRLGLCGAEYARGERERSQRKTKPVPSCHEYVPTRRIEAPMPAPVLCSWADSARASSRRPDLAVLAATKRRQCDPIRCSLSAV